MWQSRLPAAPWWMPWLFWRHELHRKKIHFVNTVCLQYVHLLNTLFPLSVLMFSFLVFLSSVLLTWAFFHGLIDSFLLWCYALLLTETAGWALAWHKAKWGIMEEWKNNEGWTPAILEDGDELWAVKLLVFLVFVLFDCQLLWLTIMLIEIHEWEPSHYQFIGEYSWVSVWKWVHFLRQWKYDFREVVAEYFWCCDQMLQVTLLLYSFRLALTFMLTRVALY